MCPLSSVKRVCFTLEPLRYHVDQRGLRKVVSKPNRGSGIKIAVNRVLLNRVTTPRNEPRGREYLRVEGYYIVYMYSVYIYCIVVWI